MKLHSDTPGARNTVTSYGAGFVEVDGQRHTESILVTPQADVAAWGVVGFDALRPEDFERLREFEAEVVLFGTGERQRFPHPRLTASLTNAGVGVEVMDTGAACRTYNILVSEGRRVVAALLRP